ncbi:heparinase II/III family protein [Microbacterium oryzae]|uniref:heparinase II/III domain-containing protein n=1 Tax=Microbacterium oryzae TaxID=743009 RepID=UPI0025AF4BE9|nr:heparinase II/III family protein [Microbacterium oryzae]MDN3310867.1 heparinase II/III family protein [Microbacterium oryzae]
MTKTSEAPPFRGPLSRELAAEAGVAEEHLAAALAARLAAPVDALPLAPAFDRAPDAVTLAHLLGRAEGEADTPWPQPRAHDAARFHGDGDRVAWETPAFARQHRLTRVAVLAAATGEERWLDETVDGVIMLCEQSSWCWPAHDDTFARHGAVLATVEDPYLDLGAGEVVGQLAWLDHLLGGSLDARYPGVRGRIRREARRRIFEPFLGRRDWHWLGLDGHVHNWNPWIHGNVLVAALRLLDGDDESDVRARIVALVVEGLDRYVASLPGDGAIDEGYGYWWNGACRLLEALDILAHATDLDPVAQIPSLRETVAFPHRMHLGGDWFVNAADGQARSDESRPWHALHRAARRADDAEAEAFAALHRDPSRPAADATEGLGRLLRALSDPAWLSARGSAAPLPRSVWLPSTQMLIARPHAGSPRGLAVVAKGGHNAESHNHNDVGSVIVASDGVPVVIDAGRPTYDARTFGAERYTLWPMQSEWHSVPLVRGAGQAAGRAHAAELLSVRQETGVDELVLDLAAAYDAPALSSWRRSVRHEGGSVTVRDEWSWSDDDAASGDGADATQIRLIIAGEIELAAGRALVRPLDAATPVLIEWHGAAPATVTERLLDDPMLSDVWGRSLRRIEIDVSGKSSATVTMRQDESTSERTRG